MPVGQHALRRLLRHQEAAEGAHCDGLLNIRRHQVGEGAAGPSTGVIDHHVGAADLALDKSEQALHLVGISGVAGKGTGAGLRAERAELFDLPRRQCNADALLGQQPRQRGAEAFAGAHDQGDLVFWQFHGPLPFLNFSAA